ncbi:GIY-YIG nuclease family protein [Microcystis phage MinS1]|nr:GIY-YIG nuclease family protein [Microcystis phage MinS1]
MKPVANGSSRTDTTCAWPDCHQLIDHPDVPLCHTHHRAAGLAWVRDNLDLVRAAVDATTDDRALDDARRAHDITQATAPAWQPVPTPDDPDAVVYYIHIRGSNRIKIGTTTNLQQRLVSLRADRGDLIAVEPGGYLVERQRHHQFADERYGRREEFELSDRIRTHVAKLRWPRGQDRVT